MSDRRRKIEAIVFDLDGTLCTYKEGIEGALMETFGAQQAEELPFSAERYRDEFDAEFTRRIDSSRSLRENFREKVFRKLLQESGKEELLGEVKSKVQTYEEVQKRNLILFPDVRPTLKRLRRETNLPLGLLTDGPSWMQWKKIKLLRLKDFFQSIVVSGDHRIRKPNPDIFKLILKELNTEPDKSIYVGNSLKYDIVGAKGVGMTAIRRLDGREEEVEIKPDHEIESLEELPEILSKMRKDN